MLKCGPFLAVLLILFNITSASPGYGSTNSDERGTRASQGCDIRVLRNIDKADVLEEYQDDLINAGPNQKQLVEFVKDALPPLVCKSVTKIAFYNKKGPDGAPAWVSHLRPDLINVSAFEGRLDYSEQNLRGDYWVDIQESLRNSHPDLTDPQRRKKAMEDVLGVWPGAVRRIIHEAFHCASHMVDIYAPKTVGDQFDQWLRTIYNDWPEVTQSWDTNALSEAKRVYDHVKPVLGVRGEMEFMNKSFSRLGWSFEYNVSIQDIPGVVNEPVPTGFMSRYGRKTSGEDIAEVAAYIVFENYKHNVKVENLRHLIITAQELANYSDLKIKFDYLSACDDIRNDTGIGIGPKFGALYAKMQFLLDLEFIRKSEYENCLLNGPVNQPDLRPSRSGSGEGFHLFLGQSSTASRSYRNKIRYGRDRPAGSDRIRFAAEGDTVIDEKNRVVRYILRFDPPNGGFPRGGHRIEACGSRIEGVFLPNFSALLPKAGDLPEDIDYFCMRKGVVYIIRANNEKIEGFISVQSVMTNYLSAPLGTSLTFLLNPHVPKNSPQTTFFGFSIKTNER